MSHDTVHYPLATAGETSPFQGTRLHTKKRPPFNFKPRALFFLFAITLSLTSLSTTVSAAALTIHGDRLNPLSVADDLTWEGSSLILDEREPPTVPLLMPPLENEEEPTKTWDAPPAKRSATTQPSASASDFTVPSPFDTGLSNNFTTSCGNFITRLRANDAFNNCHPFSLLLQVCLRLLLIRSY